MVAATKLLQHNVDRHHPEQDHPHPAKMMTSSTTAAYAGAAAGSPAATVFPAVVDGGECALLRHDTKWGEKRALV